MPPDGTVFLQSDVRSVLDEMRRQFRAHPTLFVDDVGSVDRYVERNVLEIPTEREVSVLERGLAVYRSVFTRTATPVVVSTVASDPQRTNDD
jgi:tRNA (guanine-N7-)-methyltransferase